MSWYWKPVEGEIDAQTRDDIGLDDRFDSQGDAESWLGEFYPDLVDAGITAVVLYDEDRQVYGPMRLETDED